MAFEERREIEHWTTDIYRVDVVSVLRGDVRGTVRVTFAPDEEPAQRLVDGETYVFATQAWEDGEVVKDGQVLMFQGKMQPVDDTQLAAWKNRGAAAGARVAGRRGGGGVPGRRPYSPSPSTGEVSRWGGSIVMDSPRGAYSSLNAPRRAEERMQAPGLSTPVRPYGSARTR
ncbi:hypothetical protein OG361_00370 [Streptomyces sp. NBC_00090]|uniref:hypothetical protein n=1 Tax=Streptomyces sp. NBC_00090 TaxID=2903619 RepID=UPI003254EFF9